MIKRTLPIGVALALVVGATGSASAQKVRYKRDKSVKPKVVKSERTRKLIKKPRDPKLAKPQITPEGFINLLGKQGYLTNAQINATKQLIKITAKNHRDQPDLHFRLSEQYASQQRYWHLRAMDLYPKVDAAKGGKRKSLEKKQKKYFSEAKKFLKNAIASYEAMFRNESTVFRNYKRMDMALFYYAFTLNEAYKAFKKQVFSDKSRRVYARIIKDYPGSKYIPHAYLAFGEYFFNKSSLSSAEEFYNKALKFKKSSIYAYAMFKKGWVHLNQRRYKDAQAAFYEVVKKTKGDKEKSHLNRQSKRDFVKAYAETGEAKRAYNSFAKVDKGYAFDMLMLLGDLYMADGKAKKAIFTFRDMIKRRPKHKMVCEWQGNVVHAMLSEPKKTKQADEIVRLVNLYTAYKKRKILPEENLEECYTNAEGYAKDMAKTWHNEALKTLDFRLLAHAEKLYDVYLANFKDSEDYGDMQYWSAETLWLRAERETNRRLQTERWEKAAMVFTGVVKTGKVGKGKLKDAALASVLAWKNALDVDPRVKSVDVPDELGDEKVTVPKPKPIGERQKKMMAAFDVYIKYIKNPKDDELVVMKFLKARIYWRHNHFDKAKPLLKDIIKSHSDHESAVFAANIMLDTLIRTKEHTELVELIDLLEKRKEILEQNDELAERLVSLKTLAMWKSAEDLQNKKDYNACGKAFLELANRDLEAEKAPTFLWNSAQCYENSKSIQAAINLYKEVANRYASRSLTNGGDLARQAVMKLGYNNARVARFKDAAEHYENYAFKYSAMEDAFEAASSAVLYEKGLGNDKKAIKVTLDFASKFGNPSAPIQRLTKKGPRKVTGKERKKLIKERLTKAAEAYFSLYTIYEKKNQPYEVVKHLQKYLKSKHKAHGGVDREIIANAIIGMIYWKLSCPKRGVMDSCVRVYRKRATRKFDKRKKKKKAKLRSQCGPEDKVKLTVLSRKKNYVKVARTYLDRTISIFEKKGKKAKLDDATRKSLMIKHYAAARFYKIEREYEKFLAVPFPKKLDFDPEKPKLAKKSKERFQKWLAARQADLYRLAYKQDNKGKLTPGDYRKVVDITGGGATYAIAAAARIGQMMQNLSGKLFTTPIPKYLKKGQFAADRIMAYCDALDNAAAPLEDQAVGAFGFCLTTSTKLSWFSKWSKLCEKELGQIRPSDWPTASELQPSAVSMSTVLRMEKPALTLPESEDK